MAPVLFFCGASPLHITRGVPSAPRTFTHNAGVAPRSFLLTCIPSTCFRADVAPALLEIE